MRPYCALLLVSAVLVSFAPAKNKPKDMNIWMMPLEACNALFYVEQEPNPFLKDVIEFKDKGAVKFRRGKETLENYPDEITLKIHYRPIVSSFVSTTIPTKGTKSCSPMDDPNTVKFQAAWSNKSRTVMAEGTVLNRQRYGPEPLCEHECAESWTYELRIESKGVPLTDKLLITIDSAEGKAIAKLSGGLGPLKHGVNPIAP